VRDKRLVLESIAVVLGLCVVFFLGVQYGEHKASTGSEVDVGEFVAEENETNTLHGDSERVPDQHLGSRVVDSTASYEVDGYSISFRTEDGDRYLQENGWSGYTWGNGSIVVKSGMSVTWTYDVCRHEVKHNLYPELNHSEMESESSVEARNTCLKLLYLLNW